MVVYTGNFIMVYYEDVERWLLNDTNTPTKNEDQMIEEQRTLKDYR